MPQPWGMLKRSSILQTAPSSVRKVYSMLIKCQGKRTKKMSVEATIWAWSLTKQQVSSLEKLILLSLADRANEKMECFPSAGRLEKDCNTNIKTIYKSLEALCQKNIIKKTGEMKGRTKSVPVYRLLKVQTRETKSTPKNGLSKNEAHPKTGEVAHPKTGELSTPKNGSQNLSVEPNKRTYQTTTTESVVVVLNSQKITTQLLAAFTVNPVETKNIKNENDFLFACEYSIVHRNDGNNGELYTEEERVRGIVKLVKEGNFEDPKGWSKQKPANKAKVAERLKAQEDASMLKWQEEETIREIERKRKMETPVTIDLVEQKGLKRLGGVLAGLPMLK